MNTDSNIISIVLMVVIAIAAIGYKFLEAGADKDILKRQLEKKKASNIVVSKEWIDTDRDTRTYYVSYVDDMGKQHNRVCKLHISDIYWQDEDK